MAASRIRNKAKQRVSGRNRTDIVSDIRHVIEQYFQEDPEFCKQLETNIAQVFRTKVEGLGHANPYRPDSDKESIYQQDFTEEQLDILYPASCSEKQRVSLVIYLKGLPTMNPHEVVKDLKTEITAPVQSFSNGQVTIKDIISAYEKRWQDSFHSIVKKYPLSVVADMSEYRKKSRMDCLVQGLNAKWNLLFANDLQLVNIQESSLVLSDFWAVSRNHFHPWMFYNAAFSGTKAYLLFDVEEASEKLRPLHQWTKVNLRTGVSYHSKPKNHYRDILNPKITRKLTFAEFMKLDHSYFAVISSQHDQRAPKEHLANFILVPSRYAHEVYTIGTGVDSEVYAGLSGFAMPNNVYTREDPDFKLLVLNATLGTGGGDVKEMSKGMSKFLPLTTRKQSRNSKSTKERKEEKMTEVVQMEDVDKYTAVPYADAKVVEKDHQRSGEY